MRKLPYMNGQEDADGRITLWHGLIDRDLHIAENIAIPELIDRGMDRIARKRYSLSFVKPCSANNGLGIAGAIAGNTETENAILLLCPTWHLSGGGRRDESNKKERQE